MKRAALLMHSRTALLILVEIIVGILSSLALAVSFIDLSTEIVDKNVLFYDQLLSRFIYSFRTPVLTSIMLFITDLGADYILIGVAAIVIFLIWKKHKKEAMLFLIITLMGLIINLALKQLIARPRPLISPLISITNYSYPSGHAMNSFIFYATLAFYVCSFDNSHRIQPGLSWCPLSHRYPRRLLCRFLVVYYRYCYRKNYGLP
jgi:membrane-associated phospholipid phosphatase